MEEQRYIYLTHTYMYGDNTMMHLNLGLFGFFFQDFSWTSDIMFFVPIVGTFRCCSAALSASFWLRSKFYLGEDGIK